MSMGPHDMRDGLNISENKKRDLMMLPSEIANLPDLTALVKLKNYDFVLSEWEWEATPDLHRPFWLREDLSLEHIVAQQKEIAAKAAQLQSLEQEKEAHALELQAQQNKVQPVIDHINKANLHRFKEEQKAELNALQNALYTIHINKITDQDILQSGLLPEGLDDSITIQEIKGRVKEI